MTRYEPTNGMARPCEEGEYVTYKDHLKIVMALAECRAALKLITELPSSVANNIAIQALRKTEP